MDIPVTAARKGREGANEVRPWRCAALPRTAMLTDGGKGLVRATDKHRQGRGKTRVSSGTGRSVRGVATTGVSAMRPSMPRHHPGLPCALIPWLFSLSPSTSSPVNSSCTQPFPAALDIASLQLQSLKPTRTRQLLFNTLFKKGYLKNCFSAVSLLGTRKGQRGCRSGCRARGPPCPPG